MGDQNQVGSRNHREATIVAMIISPVLTRLACEQTQLENKIAPFVRKTIDTALGLQEEDLSNAVIQHIKEQAGPEVLLETLEPVSIWVKRVIHSIADTRLACDRSWKRTQVRSLTTSGACWHSNPPRMLPVWRPGR